MTKTNRFDARFGKSSDVRLIGLCIAMLLALVPLMMWHHKIARIPVPTSVTVLPDQLLWDNDQWTMDCKTGRVARREGPEVLLFRGGKRIGIDYLQDTKQLSVSLQSLDGKPELQRPVDLWGLPEVLSGRYLIRESRNRLEAVDLQDESGRVVTASFPPIQNSGGSAGSGSLIMIDGTNRFVRNNFSSGADDFSLYAIEPEQIRLLAKFPGPGDVVVHSDCLFVSKQAASDEERRVEVRSTTDGVLLETIPVPRAEELFDQTPHYRMEGDLLILHDGPWQRFAAYDWRRRIMLDLSSNNCFPRTDSRSPYVFLQAVERGQRHRVTLFNPLANQVYRELEAPLSYANFGFLDGDHLYFTNQAHGFSVAVVNVHSGQVKQRWAPYAGVSWSSLLFCPLMAIWMIAWCKISARVGWWVWFDVLLIGILCAIMVAYRLETRFAGVDIAPLPCAQLLLMPWPCAAWWLVMANRRLIPSLTVLLMIAGVTQFALLLLIGDVGRVPRWEMPLAGIVTMTYAAFVASIMRRRRWGVCRVGEALRPVSLFDYMAVTVAAAVFINAFRKCMPLTLDIDSELVTTLFVPFVIGVFGLPLALTENQRYFWLGLGMAGLPVVGLVGAALLRLISGAGWTDFVRDWLDPHSPVNNMPYDWHLHGQVRLVQIFIFGLVSPFFLALPLRLRGWRMRNLSLVSDDSVPTAA